MAKEDLLRVEQDVARDSISVIERVLLESGHVREIVAE